MSLTGLLLCQMRSQYTINELVFDNIGVECTGRLIQNNNIFRRPKLGPEGLSVFRGTIIRTGNFLPFADAQKVAESLVLSFPDVNAGTVCEPVVSYV
jgi:hypothetical protein